ncbi:MAG: peroxidase family protein [Myxococcota bacterium]
MKDERFSAPSCVRGLSVTQTFVDRSVVPMLVGLTLATMLGAGCSDTTPAAPSTDGYRSIDGTGNNTRNRLLGAANTRLVRWSRADYGDGVSEPAGIDLPSTRMVSNALCQDVATATNEFGASDFLWQWGQFLDHDISLTETAEPEEPMPIEVPLGDPSFDPQGTGTAVIEFSRSIFDRTTGTDEDNPREQINEITHFIDASLVYGSDEERASALRADDGSGRLRMSEGNLLPFNTDGLPNAGGADDPALFLAGDVRANEQVGLAAVHTLFVREHNRVADELLANDPSMLGEEVYQLARRYVGALMQGITYNEFLPALLGPDALAPYEGYDSSVDPSIANEFSTGIYRFGHSALSANLLRLDADGDEIEEGHLGLRDAFFRPDRLAREGGIEPLLRGLAGQACSAVDTEVVDDVRDFLFGPPGAGGLDLASLNLQRGRDHGLPRYNEVRAALGLAVRQSFDEVSTNPDTRERLSSVYDRVDDLDVWVGALAEDAINGGHLGELAFVVMKRQFEALRDGDRFWYERQLSDDEIDEIDSTTLADVIRRNTTIGDELSDDVFHVR